MIADKEHIVGILRWLGHEVASAGGDGDAVWYSRYHSLDEILPILKEYNKSLGEFWNIELKENSIFWGKGQEGVQITTDKDYFNNLPEWVQAKLYW